MNRKNIVINLLLALIVFGFTSCYDEEMDVPPANIPTVNFPATHTINEFKRAVKYNDSQYATLDSIEENIVIKGTVVSTDETGNIYKSIFIQDDSAGIQISIDLSGLFNTFVIGQEVYIKCQGLYCGNYGTALQIGAKFNGKVGRMTQNQMKAHIFKNGIPGKPLDAVKVEIEPANTATYNGMYIQIDSLDLRSDTSKVWAEASATTNRTAYDPRGRKIIFRTSNYSTFRQEKTPNKLFSVKGIYTKFNTDAQLYILRTSDVVKH